MKITCSVELVYVRGVAEFADFCYYTATVPSGAYLGCDCYELAGAIKLGGN